MKLDIKPKKHELNDFKLSEIKVDEFWKDLYDYEPKKLKKHGKKTNTKRNY